ncbi:hypothetical protein [Cryptosporangium sp. NPDC051539]|uniref:hypothetical protein n=1 Tax=Cryptosporangium sp. NPDC051539 TaxID=3363962 RepID=UPI0037AD5AB8
MSEFRYPAYRMYQTDTGKPLVLFAAPAADIEHWAGVPQRKRLDERETLGFQREGKPERVREIASFFRDPRNVVQNPLLAALQDSKAVQFIPFDNESPFGELIIDASGLESLPLVELLRRLADLLRHRVPSLGDYEVPGSEVDRLLSQVQTTYTAEDVLPDESDDDVEADQAAPESEAQDPDEIGEAELGAVLLSEETNIVEFYTEVQARVQALDRISNWSRQEFLGFTREAVLAYLLPVVLVDGQHRLRGAVQAAEGEMQDEQNRGEIYERIGRGGSPEDVQHEGLSNFSRRLPVSLLMNESPSEHVFQFVVVNQKATPMPSALLGTIVATSLGVDELEPVAQRLRNAGINLDDSRAIAYLTRAPESPFYGLVQTGMTSDRNGQLQWTVFQGLVRIFREFSGGRLYGQKNDYAAIWAKKCLPSSSYVSDVQGLTEMKKIWGEPAGPWRDIFIRFFAEIRTFFGDPDDMGAHNAWGSTRSNLFNKISLTILAADYFEFLSGREETLSSAEDVTQTVGLWLKDVNPQYFARDWRLTREKKDSTKIRTKWASLWFEYRRNPTRLPSPGEYTKV